MGRYFYISGYPRQPHSWRREARTIDTRTRPHANHVILQDMFRRYDEAMTAEREACDCVGSDVESCRAATKHRELVLAQLVHCVQHIGD